MSVSDAPLDRVLLEAVSAFATGGLSVGLSGELEPFGKYVLAALMLAARRAWTTCTMTNEDVAYRTRVEVGQVAEVEDTAAVEATLIASRALLGVVARSLTGVLQEISLPQFRVLVILSTQERLRIGRLAAQLHMNRSTFSRVIDRMTSKDWVRRVPSSDSRREVLVEITDSGAAIVSEVTERRRQEIARILERMPMSDQHALVDALNRFSLAAGEPAATELLDLGL
ncbi:DNA-binding transcriptional regulator, MarR family [Plantibacter cousiniae]|uniref:DNA-binding transcriptional regulator, MarR family n=2 Tax=Plantibacter cousiniae (nom. nud.) TaxID=199709 RepID=A0ABY1LHJ5_9MICO|nr:DNA-binding transcriptional regulator, MarR family [Plantibacter cousiniae]